MKKLSKIGLPLAITVMAITACSSSEGPDIQGEVSSPHRIEITSAQKRIINKGNEFAYKAWDKICEKNTNKDGNQIFSPLSMQLALSLLANGAEGDVLDELVNLYTEGTGNEGLDNLNVLNRKLLKELPLVDKNTQILFANSIWCDNNLEFQANYVSKCAEFYDAAVHKYDVGTERARLDINKWCSDNTNGLIKDFLNNPPYSEAMLANATYFKGKWKHPFNKKNTREEDFFCESGETKKVDMMVADDYVFKGKVSEEMVYVEIPYQNEGLQMNILMPKEGNDFNECVRKLANNDVDWEKNCLVKLSVPKFEVSALYTNLQNVILEFGVKHIQDPLVKVLEDRNFYVSEIIQVSKIKTDEEGSEAAAVTAVVSFSSVNVPSEIEIKIDRPFFFTIEEQSTGAILFMGKVAEF